MGYPKGRPRTEEQKRAHSERMKGRVFTEEHRRKMSEGPVGPRPGHRTSGKHFFPLDFFAPPH